MSADVSGFAPPSEMTWTQEERDNPTLLYKITVLIDITKYSKGSKYTTLALD